VDPDFNGLVDLDTSLPLGSIPVMAGARAVGVFQIVTYRGYENVDQAEQELSMTKPFIEGMQVLASCLFHLLVNSVGEEPLGL
jgi:hypothetical protein